MKAINALNKYITNKRQESNLSNPGHFIVIKKKEKALFVGPLKRYTLEVWYVLSRKEKYNVLNISLNKQSLNEATDDINWESIEELLIYEIYNNISKEGIDRFIYNSFKEIKTREIDMNKYDTSK